MVIYRGLEEELLAVHLERDDLKIRVEEVMMEIKSLKMSRAGYVTEILYF